MNATLLGFTGVFRDSVSAAYPLGNGYRWYLPTLMRFNAADSLSPFGLGGLNPYVYCADDPINRRDPTGHMWQQEVEEIESASIRNAATQEERSASIAATEALSASRQTEESAPSTSRQVREPRHQTREYRRQVREHSRSRSPLQTLRNRRSSSISSSGEPNLEFEDRQLGLSIAERNESRLDKATIDQTLASLEQRLEVLELGAENTPNHLPDATAEQARIGGLRVQPDMSAALEVSNNLHNEIEALGAQMAQMGVEFSTERDRTSRLLNRSNAVRDGLINPNLRGIFTLL